ncbi:MAG: LysM peptidoglycan-binding domain-containing protein, partial [Phycisphaerales bacterium]|nr:LysM peptidoglycan-binding domain-containing protein [Phycisphaerales bacterium]
MTAGTKAILLLSVVGLIVLVAWYGEGPSQANRDQDGASPSHAKDPLLASAAQTRRTRQTTRSAPSPVRQQAPPQPPARGATPPPSRWASSSQPQAPTSREEPPVLKMGQDIDTSVTGSWDQAKWDALRDQIGSGSTSTSRSALPPPPRREQRPSEKTASAPENNRKQASGSSRDSDSASQTGQKHKVKPGDTLGHLAQQYYGAASRWNLIADANPGITPASLRVGQELVIPKGSRASRPASTTNDTGLPVPDGRTHTIGEGETLSSIAEDHMGHEKHWYRIYELNEQRIGSNPDRLV